jgi:hypothetical protein
MVSAIYNFVPEESLRQITLNSLVSVISVESVKSAVTSYLRFLVRLKNR